MDEAGRTLPVPRVSAFSAVREAVARRGHPVEHAGGDEVIVSQWVPLVGSAIVVLRVGASGERGTEVTIRWHAAEGWPRRPGGPAARRLARVGDDWLDHVERAARRARPDQSPSRGGIDAFTPAMFEGSGAFDVPTQLVAHARRLGLALMLGVGVWASASTWSGTTAPRPPPADFGDQVADAKRFLAGLTLSVPTGGALAGMDPGPAGLAALAPAELEVGEAARYAADAWVRVHAVEPALADPALVGGVPPGTSLLMVDVEVCAGRARVQRAPGMLGAVAASGARPTGTFTRRLPRLGLGILAPGQCERGWAAVPLPADDPAVSVEWAYPGQWAPTRWTL